MKTIVMLLFWICCILMFGCQNIQNDTLFQPETRTPLPVPSIIANIDADPNQLAHLKFQWYYRATRVVHPGSRNNREMYWVVGSLSHIPKPTADYTRYLIFKLFLPNPVAYGNSFDPVLPENFNENAIGVLQFEPLRQDVPFKDDIVLNEIWSYRVAINALYRDKYGETYRGKRVSVERHLVSQNGHILYRGHNGPRGWTVSSCKQTSEGLVLTIIDDVQETYWRATEPLPATSTQYLYHPGASSLRKLKSEKITLEPGYYYASDFYR